MRWVFCVLDAASMLGAYITVGVFAGWNWALAFLAFVMVYGWVNYAWGGIEADRSRISGA